MLIEFGLICLVVPAIISFGLFCGVRRWTSRWAGFLPATVVLALIVPSWLLIGHEIFRPSRHWQWLSAIAASSGLLVSMCLSQRSKWLRCSICAAVLASGSAILLVPRWKELDLMRTNLIVGLAIGLFLSQMAWCYVARHRPVWAVWAIFALAFVSAGWVARSFSLANSRWLSIIAGTTFGLGLGLVVSKIRKEKPLIGDAGNFDWRMMMPLALWFGAGLFVALIEPDPPRYELAFPVLVDVILAVIVRCVFLGP